MRGTTKTDTTAGASAVRKAGTGIRSCSSSRRRRTRSAAPTISHGVGGPLHVKPGALAARRRDGSLPRIEAGIPANPDVNGPRKEGVGILPDDDHQPQTMELGAGLSGPKRAAAELTVATERKPPASVLWWPAVGVELYTPRGRKTARVRGRKYRLRRRLRLTAAVAAFRLGPADLLGEFGLTVVREMPGVGGHLQDNSKHLGVGAATRRSRVNDMAMSRRGKTQGGGAVEVSRYGHMSEWPRQSEGALAARIRAWRKPDLQIKM